MSQHLTSSRLNSTPPTGAPKATETPAAEAADSTSPVDILSLTVKASCVRVDRRFFASLDLYLSKKWAKTFPQQHATCTSGPSLPRLNPKAVARTMPNGKMPWVDEETGNCSSTFTASFHRQSPAIEIAVDDETAQNSLHLANQAFTNASLNTACICTSGMPDPAAYGASIFTKPAHVTANKSAKLQ